MFGAWPHSFSAEKWQLCRPTAFLLSLPKLNQTLMLESNGLKVIVIDKLFATVLDNKLSRLGKDCKWKFSNFMRQERSLCLSLTQRFLKAVNIDQS